MVDENRDVQNIPHTPKRRRLASEVELLRVQASLKDDPGCLDPKIHSDRVRDRGSAAIKNPRSVAVGPVLGTVRRYS
jgi:hypothetical protein